MCGIFGYIGEQNCNLSSIKILGLFNITRGKDSAGLYYGGNYKKVASFNTGTFDKLLIEKDISFNGDEKNNAVLGHTRNSSSGLVNIDNAHPFQYTLEKSKKNIYFAHNGTLRSWKKDMKKYIDVNNIDVDSNALGLLMANGHYEYLSDYEGAATFMMYREDSNNMIIWKGESIYGFGKNADSRIDRPMFCLKTKNGFYFSSIEDSLKAIQEKDDKFINLKSNTLYSFSETDYVIIKSFKRSHDNTNYVNYGNNYGYNNYEYTNKNSLKSKKALQQKYPSSHKTFDSKNNTFDSKNNLPSKIEDCKFNIFRDDKLKYDQNTYLGSVYFLKGRFYRNGHLLNGSFDLNYKGFPKHSKYCEGTTKEYTFVDGLLLKDKKDVKTVIEIIDNTKYSNYSRSLMLSKYLDMYYLDVCETNGQKTTVFSNGKLITGLNVSSMKFGRGVWFKINHIGNIEKYSEKKDDSKDELDDIINDKNSNISAFDLNMSRDDIAKKYIEDILYLEVNKDLENDEPSIKEQVVDDFFDLVSDIKNYDTDFRELITKNQISINDLAISNINDTLVFFKEIVKDIMEENLAWDE